MSFSKKSDREQDFAKEKIVIKGISNKQPSLELDN